MSNIATGAVERKACSQGPDVVAVVDVELPANLDLELFPIIAKHWYGVTPAAVCVDTVATAA